MPDTVTVQDLPAPPTEQRDNIIRQLRIHFRQLGIVEGGLVRVESEDGEVEECTVAELADLDPSDLEDLLHEQNVPIVRPGSSQEISSVMWVPCLREAVSIFKS